MMELDNNTAITEDDARRDLPGAIIRRARAQAGMTREQLAAELKLLPCQVDALEQDQYERLPGAIFVRGYLRNIARILSLDEAALLAAYRQLDPTAAAPASARVDNPELNPRPLRPMSLDQHTAPRRHWGLALAALLVVGLWGWQQHKQEVGHALSLTPTSPAGAGALPGGIENALDDSAATQLMDSVELLPADGSGTASAQKVSTGSDNASSQKGRGDSKTVTAVGDHLSLRFSADCWVEIKDRDNRVLVAALKHANDKLQLEGKGPFRVLLGFAPGVEMAYNGTPVNIEVPQGSRSTRLIVGSS